MQGQGFGYLHSLLYHPYLVCILFAMPSLHLFTFLMCFFKSSYTFHTIFYHLVIACCVVWHDQLVSFYTVLQTLINITVIGFINSHLSLRHVFV